VQRYDSGGNLVGTEFRITDEDTAGANLGSTSPAVAHTQGDEFVVVWEGALSTDRFGGPRIVGRRMNTSGEFVGTEFQINASYPDPVYGGKGPDIAAMDNGNFVVVWAGRYEQQYLTQVMGQRMSADTTKIGTEFVANTFTLGYAYDPQVATRGDGSFVVVWTARPSEFGSPPGGNSGDVFGQRFASNGNKAGSEFLVNSFTDYPENQPDVAVHSDGSFVVVWVTGTQRQPSVAMDDDGDFVVVWESLDTYNSSDNRDDGAGIFGVCFNSDGVNPGSDFHVNSYTPGRERYPSIATDGSGGFVMAWERGEGYYGGDGDVFARRFQIQSCSGSGGTTTTTTTTTLPSGGEHLAITKSDNTHFWSQDPLIAYEIEVTNNGDATQDVLVSEQVPERTTFSAAASTPGWQCTPDGGAGSGCTLTLADMTASEQRTVTFAVMVDEGTPQTWIVYNQAAASDPSVAITQRASQPGKLPIQGFPTDDDSTSGNSCGQPSPATPDLCDFCCFLVSDIFGPGVDPCLAFQLTQIGITAGIQHAAGTIESIADFSTMFRLRDRVLPVSRGGQRFVDLYYQHGPAMTGAAMVDPQIVGDAVTTLATLMPHFDALDEGTGDSSTIVQADVDAMNAFLDRLAASATADLATAIARERSRLGLNDWAGLTANEALARLNFLTCESFEDTLFCGEVTGDCRITATDALSVLNIAVGAQNARPEADLDGNGSTTATDALITLNIAVGLLGQTSDCNIP
jgi:hypothetical protein